MKFHKVMLATKATPDRLVPLCEDDAFWAEQKVDGDRCTVHIDEGKVRAVTRNGNTVSGWSTWHSQQFAPVLATNQRWVFDGEFLNKKFHVFDLVEGGGNSYTNTPLGDRRAKLEAIFGTWKPNGVTLLPVARTHLEKCELAQEVLALGGEGLVFKLRTSTIEQRRSEAWLKVKFRQTVTAEIMGLCRDGHSNIVVGVLRDGVLTEVGECTAEAGDGARGVKFAVGQLVEITYQYCSNAGKLVQPTLPRLRTDIDKPDSWPELHFVNKEVLA